MNEQNEKMTVYVGNVTPQAVQAREALRTGKIPQKAIKKHPGKGGNVFSYISHIHGTKTMNDAFDQLWDWQVEQWELFDDGSAVVRGTLSMHFYGDEGQHHVRKISEVGPFEDLTKKFSKANIIAAAASRALIRCMLRAFDYGAELYKDEEGGMTPGEAWILLKNAAKKSGLKEEDLVSMFQSSGFPKEELVDRFEEAWKMVYDLSVAKKQEREEEQARVRKEREEVALTNKIAQVKLAIGAAMKAKGHKASEAKDVIGDLADKIVNAQNIQDIDALSKEALAKIAELPDPQ